MRIGQRHLALSLRTNLVAARLSPGDEILLLRSEAVRAYRTRLAFQRLLQCEISQAQAAEIANALAQHQLSIFVHAAVNGVAVELIDNALRPLLKSFVVG